MGNDNRYVAPADADEFYRQDAGYILALARKWLGENGNSQDAEDVASDIMYLLISSTNSQGENALKQYKPEYESEHTGHRVSWRTFLSGKVHLYMKGKREQVGRRNDRERLWCDAPVGDGEDRWIDHFGGQHLDDYPSMTDDEVCRHLRDYLATLPDVWDSGLRQPGGDGQWSYSPQSFSLLDAFDHVRRQEAEGRKLTLPLPRTARDEAMGRLREAVRQAGTAPDPGKFDVEGVILSAAEVRDAVDKLRAGKGNHVHVPLRNHRLQLDGPKGWYHRFSALERKLFPECAMDPQSHRRPADHVKRAVIHRLERMLAEAGVAPVPSEPEPETTATDLFEGELWKLGLDAPTVDAVLDAAGRTGLL